jgi:hypothetical protein
VKAAFRIVDEGKTKAEHHYRAGAQINEYWDCWLK